MIKYPEERRTEHIERVYNKYINPPIVINDVSMKQLYPDGSYGPELLTDVDCTNWIYQGYTKREDGKLTPEMLDKLRDDILTDYNGHGYLY